MMMRFKGRVALIAGATGLVGRACLHQLLQRPEYDQVIALVRRPLERVEAKLRCEVVDFRHPERIRPMAADVAFCALGTTMAAAGSPEAFRSVDYLSILTVADLAVQGGADQFVLVSSAGADPESRNFYLHVKGDTEAAVAKRPFGALHVLRPGLLLGDRRQSRPAEAVARRLAPWLNVLLVGKYRRYRAIAADRVAAAMVAAALEGVPGHHVLHYDDIVHLAAHLPPPSLPAGERTSGNAP